MVSLGFEDFLRFRGIDRIDRKHKGLRLETQTPNADTVRSQIFKDPAAIIGRILRQVHLEEGKILEAGNSTGMIAFNIILTFQGINLVIRRDKGTRCIRKGAFNDHGYPHIA